ncbi:MAG: 3-deoxy-manno-octulosonate cytidylyltransferase [Alphaproteobacteria bacterium HGW-Alphaproteobacteria-7]|jgi:3-deoxy-manno-octulosonate cytidylyltransferase (CMP-KDO synthetase)|nr:MAG: 3-deoxy-manno-octulosonate cytidylyltransferase [Alphaproteobacteria bacterium HGW-Alphaproteobacteria-7]
MASITIIIPARFASSRFPAKPLASLIGPDGIARPAICYTWQAGLAAARALGPGARCVIATDDDQIADVARAQDMQVVMTPVGCANGTERCAAALSALGDQPDIVINLQGDAPLTPAAMVVAVAALLDRDPALAMATAAVPASPAVLAHLQSDAAAGRVGGTTVVCNSAARALYFSKSVIPHVAPGTTPRESVLLHLGLYAYRPAALAAYAAQAPAPLELQEGLEQLRFLDAGLPVGVTVCAAPGWEMIELNNPTDVPLIEAELARRAAMEPF